MTTKGPQFRFFLLVRTYRRAFAFTHPPLPSIPLPTHPFLAISISQACNDSPASSNRLLLALCKHATTLGHNHNNSHQNIGGGGSPPDAQLATTKAMAVDTSKAGVDGTAKNNGGGGGAVNGNDGIIAGAVAGAGGGGGGGFCPILLSPPSFAALATLLRAALDQAASNREFLQARNCLVMSALFAVHGADYVSWLRTEASTSSEGLTVMADSELVSAADALDHQQQQQQGRDSRAESPLGGGAGGGSSRSEALVGGEEGKALIAMASYLLQRELRRHPVWSTIELWEVSMSDSVVMAMAGGGERAERWLPTNTLTALEEVRCLC